MTEHRTTYNTSNKTVWAIVTFAAVLFPWTMYFLGSFELGVMAALTTISGMVAAYVMR